MERSFIIEWTLFRPGTLNLELYFLFDWISLLFISFIFLISSIIILYRYIYIYNDNFNNRFIYLLVLFICSIVLIIIRPNIFRILFGWDGLGLTSYCLVVYYQNYISYNSGIVTLLRNRVGDIRLLILIGLIIVNGRWNMGILLREKLFIIILLVAAITKRAQIPFSSWLPRAIRAPTPVSALVHSSTLVTAGIYLIIRFNKFLIFRGINEILFFISILTIFIAGITALSENDFKKIIALSTLSQLGLIIIIIRLGLELVAFYHLLTHAIFKSLLFICVGVIIHVINNNQDIRLLGIIYIFIPFTVIRLFISNISLCGFPFLAGFYSKDLIIELIYTIKINFIILVLIILSLIFTVIYSFRLFYFILFREVKFYRYNNIKENSIINISIIILIINRIIVGSLINWIFFYDYYIIYLTLDVKILTLFICIIGVIVRFIIWVQDLISSCCYFLIFYLRSLGFINYIYIWIYYPLNNIEGDTDKVWLEFQSIWILERVIRHKIINIDLKIYIIRYFFIILRIILYLLY